jgi:hypothetical protein
MSTWNGELSEQTWLSVGIMDEVAALATGSCGFNGTGR